MCLEPGDGQVLVKVSACGVCRTDLHIVDGDLTDGALPIVPGHEIVGEVVAVGAGVSALAAGDRVGVPWLGHTCGSCRYCGMHAENLCDAPGFTGYTIDGGYADYAVADADYCFPIKWGCSRMRKRLPCFAPDLIGHRSLKMTGDAECLGIYGFGAAAHIVAQVARHQGPTGLRLHPAGGHSCAGIRDRSWCGVGRQFRPAGTG